MNDNVVGFISKTLKSQAMMAIANNPDVVTQEVSKIKIKKEDFDFWEKFLLEWSSLIDALYKRDRESLLKNRELDFIRKKNDLGLLTLATLFDKLKKRDETQASDFIFSMNSIDCFFIPVYLEDYLDFNKFAAKKSELYLQVILHALAEGKQINLDQRLESIEELVCEYIEKWEPIYLT